MPVPPEVEAEFNAQLDEYMDDWETSLRAHLKEVGAGESEENEGGTTQLSIVDPPARDTATSRAAKQKEKLSEAATPLALAIRARLDSLLKKKLTSTPAGRLLALRRAESLITDAAELARQTLSDTILASWLAGADHALAGTPDAFTPPIVAVPGFSSGPPRPPVPPVTASDLFGGDGDDEGPLVTFPGLDGALESLQAREIVTPDEFRQLSGAARQKAFTVTADLAVDSIAKLRDALAEDLEEGPSLGSFRDKVLEAFDTLPVSESHLENVYRSNVQEAFSQGMEKVLDHPLVDDAFPYRLYVRIRDARCRATHAALEQLGLDGTAVYHKSDPTWLKFRPPWEWECRCGWIALSIETAASMGAKEAVAWLAAIKAAEEAGEYDGRPSSVEPDHIWVPPPPFEPPAGWRRDGV